MDGLTAVLAGAALAEAGPRRRFGAPATFLIAVAAIAPDADLIFGLADRDSLVFDRRTITHSILALPLIAAALAAIWKRWMPETKFLHRFGLACAGTFLHALLDAVDATGFHPYAPLSDATWRMSWMAPFDPWLWAILGAGLVAARLSEHWAATSARSALVIATIYVFLCGGYHALANAQMKEALTRLGIRPERIAVYPQILSPIRWNAIGWVNDRYYQADIHALRGLEGRIKVFIRQPVPEKLKGPFTARFEKWAHAPLVRPLAEDQGGGLAICDLRFLGRPEGLPYVARIGEDAGGTTRHAWLSRRLAPPVPDEEYELPRR